MKKNSLIFVVIAALFAACSSSDNEPSPDAGSTPDVSPQDIAITSDLPQDVVQVEDIKVYPDLPPLPDLPVKAPCESEWTDAINPQTKVSTGEVKTQNLSGGVFQTTVDAKAGGMNQSVNNPYVYVSFKDGSHVDINDLEAKTSTEWDMAFKRAVIRVNGGDSGPGQGAIAIVANKTLDQVTSLPANASFAADNFLDENCKILRDPINNVLTAIGGQTGLWYDYDSSSMKVSPKPDTYLVRRADGSVIKLVIDSYYNTAGAGGFYTLRWSPL